jgi:hypothetical protein
VSGRSWLDWLTDAIDAAPAPRWAVYAAAFALWVAIAVGLSWALALRPFPDVALSPVVAGIFPVILVWSTQLLNDVADEALASLAPALKAQPDGLGAIQRDLRRTPAAPALAVVPLAIAVGAIGILSGPESWELRRGDPALAWALTILVSIAGTMAAFGFLVHAIHQLRLVDDIHRRLVSIDLFRLEPLYAFARLTSLTGVTLLGIVIGGAGLASFAVPSFELAPTDYVTFGFLIVVAVASFIVPLLGLHGRIEAEKDDRMAEAQATLAASLAEVRRRVADGDFDGAATLSDTVAAARSGVEVVGHVSTWPWRAETLRGFLSAVLLPIVLWVVITILGRLLPT